jgi:hypothetical protein
VDAHVRISAADAARRSAAALRWAASRFELLWASSAARRGFSAPSGRAMKNRFDRMAKNVYSEALAPMAEVKTGLETSPDAQIIDLWCEANREPLEELGLLGRMAREPCLLEPYSGTVTLDEVRHCVRKQDARYQELQHRDASAWKVPPWLWIISTGLPVAALGLGFEPCRAWPRGFYELPEPWRVKLVVRSELRRERATLLVRITGVGRVLREAVEDLKQEPEDSRLRRLLARELARMHCELRAESGGNTPEEEEFAMTGEEMLREVEARARSLGERDGRAQGEKLLREVEARARSLGERDGRAQGEREGREDGLRWGREEEARRMVRLAFEERFGPMPASLEEAVGKIAGVNELERAMKICLTRTRDEVEQALIPQVH